MLKRRRSLAQTQATMRKRRKLLWLKDMLSFWRVQARTPTPVLERVASERAARPYCAAAARLLRELTPMRPARCAQAKRQRRGLAAAHRAMGSASLQS